MIEEWLQSTAGCAGCDEFRRIRAERSDLGSTEYYPRRQPRDILNGGGEHRGPVGRRRSWVKKRGKE